MSEMLPSGTQTKIENRVNWALYDLFRAGLLERPVKGRYSISEEGHKVLSNPPPKIDRKYLTKYDSFREFAQSKGKASKGSNLEEGEIESTGTPDERIALAHAEITAGLQSEILEALAEVDPYWFEQIVIDLLFAMGYGGSREEAAKVTKKSNDGGIDGIINEDRLGLDVIYVQAKRWQATVGRVDIQNFVGALAGKQANKGVFITTSGFNSKAIEFAESVPQKVILINGDRLADLMIEHNIGVSVSRSFLIKKIDTDYFEQG